MSVRLPLISVIMPAFNAERFIQAAIDSVLAQTWTNWELIIVNDGSTDGTAAVLERIDHPRIRVVHQENRGVSAARNTALDLAQGEFLAFLDADDLLPPNSLAARSQVMLRDPAIHFVDGAVRAIYPDGSSRKIYTPTFRGAPYPELMAINTACFFGCTWMIRRTPDTDVRFPEALRYAEDLAYYLSMSRAGTYDHTEELVLLYRKGHVSAMSDLRGLEKGYLDLYRFTQDLRPAPTPAEAGTLWRRITNVMFRSFLKAGRPLAAIRAYCRRPPR